MAVSLVQKKKKAFGKIIKTLVELETLEISLT